MHLDEAISAVRWRPIGHFDGERLQRERRRGQDRPHPKQSKRSRPIDARRQLMEQIAQGRRQGPCATPLELGVEGT